MPLWLREAKHLVETCLLGTAEGLHGFYMHKKLCSHAAADGARCLGASRSERRKVELAFAFETYREDTQLRVGVAGVELVRPI